MGGLGIRPHRRRTAITTFAARLSLRPYFLNCIGASSISHPNLQTAATLPLSLIRIAQPCLVPSTFCSFGNLGPGLNKCAQVLFSGCSSGGRGALFNLDYIPSMLPPGVEVRGIFDSAMWINVEPFPTSKLTSLTDQTKKVSPTHYVSSPRLPCAPAIRV